jgi:hypothetical protein
MAAKARWVQDTRELAKRRLGEARGDAFTLPDTYPDIPFIYRAMEWARPGTQIALITHARWLFPGQARDEARRDLLESVQVTGILNGAALRETSVWPGSRAPFAILFARNEKPSVLDGAFQFVSPVLTEELQKTQRRMRIDWSHGEIVGLQSVLADPWLLKLRFRGTAFDHGVLRKLIDGHPTLECHLESLGTHFKRGYQVVDRSTPSNLDGLPDLVSDQRRAKESPEQPSQSYRIDVEWLMPFAEPMVHREPTREECAAPLLLLKTSPPAALALARTSISERPLAFSQSWFAASFSLVEDGLARARWQQLLLQSSVLLYFALLTDGWFGVERDRYVLETLKAFPVVPYDQLTRQQRERAHQLSEVLWAEGWSQGIKDTIDDLAFDAYDLVDVERDCIRDTLATSLPYAEQRRDAVREPEKAQIDKFVAVLEEELSGVLETSGTQARVHARRDVAVGPWGVVQVDRGARARRDADIPWPKILEEADASGATLVTARVDAVTTLIAILKHYRYWTPTRARILALSLLSEKTT